MTIKTALGKEITMGLINLLKRFLNWTKKGSMPEDKKLRCYVCGKEFVFEAGEQIFYQAKGFTEPKRCPSCRKNVRHHRKVNRR